jgi:hypothetical protein
MDQTAAILFLQRSLLLVVGTVLLSLRLQEVAAVAVLVEELEAEVTVQEAQEHLDKDTLEETPQILQTVPMMVLAEVVEQDRLERTVLQTMEAMEAMAFLLLSQALL